MHLKKNKGKLYRLGTNKELVKINRKTRKTFMNLEGDGEECTAAPGVMGYSACNRYPGCGCHDSNDDENKSEEDYDEEPEIYKPEPKWTTINMPSSVPVKDLGHGKFSITFKNRTYINPNPVRAKVEDNKFIVFRDDLYKYKNLADLFGIHKLPFSMNN